MVALSVAYFFVIALPKHNRDLLDLQRENVELEREKFPAIEASKEKEEQENKYNQEISKIDAKYRENSLRDCIQYAEEDYWSYVRPYGQEVPGQKASNTAPPHIYDTARKVKKEALDECHRQWDPKW